jgi:EmrB/QacA subfamily drug resistance transporter
MTPPSASPPTRWWPLVAICLGTFMLLVDVTIVGVALPSMATDLHASLASLQWVVDGYALSLAALVLVGGSLADRFGRRRLFELGLMLFAGASLACALAPGAGLLIAARTVQGIGGAAMFATNSALIAASYEGRARGIAFGIWGGVNGAAAAIAPILGGLLIQAFDWRSIFLVNLPIAVVALGLTRRALSESRGHSGSIDWLGAASFTTAAAAVTFGLIRGGESGWGSAPSIVAFAGSAVAAVVFLVAQGRRTSPLIDLDLLRRPAFATLMVAAVLLSAGAFAVTAYTQLWLQSVLELSPIDAGLVLAPLAMVAFAVSAGIGRFMHGMPARWPLGGGLVLIGAGALLRTMITGGSGWSVLLAGLVVTGVGVGLASPVLVAAGLAAAPRERAGMASGAVNTFRQLGFALGIAVLGTLFTNRLVSGFANRAGLGDGHRAAALAGGGETRALVSAAPPASRDLVGRLVHVAYAGALDRIYLVSGVAAIAGGLLVLTLVRPASPAAPASESVPVPASAEPARQPAELSTAPR